MTGQGSTGLAGQGLKVWLVKGQRSERSDSLAYCFYIKTIVTDVDV